MRLRVQSYIIIHRHIHFQRSTAWIKQNVTKSDHMIQLSIQQPSTSQYPRPSPGVPITICNLSHAFSESHWQAPEMNVSDLTINPHKFYLITSKNKKVIVIFRLQLVFFDFFNILKYNKNHLRSDNDVCGWYCVSGFYYIVPVTLIIVN